MLNSRIAKVRVHIERSNQRIKTFNILGSLLHAQLVPVLEDIFKVICATVNMCSPILKDNKFMQNEFVHSVINICSLSCERTLYF